MVVDGFGHFDSFDGLVFSLDLCVVEGIDFATAVDSCEDCLLVGILKSYEDGFEGDGVVGEVDPC